jgi:hypothetical protein
MAFKIIKIAILAAIVSIAGYWYWSPFVAVWQLQSAAQKKDAIAFNNMVDYPKVRESLKGQFSALLAVKFAKPSESGNDLTKTGAAIGTMIGMVMANQFIEAVVRPEVIMRAMQDGQLSPQATPARIGTQPPANKPTQLAGAKLEDDKLSWTYEREGTNKLIAYATHSRNQEKSNQEKLGLALQRTGFATWKLTEVRLPALNNM